MRKALNLQGNLRCPKIPNKQMIVCVSLYTQSYLCNVNKYS